MLHSNPTEGFDCDESSRAAAVIDFFNSSNEDPSLKLVIAAGRRYSMASKYESEENKHMYLN